MLVNEFLLLGAVLFLSPWVFGFAAGAQSQNAWITGIVIAVLSIAALAAFAEWLNLVAGLWAIAAPWVLGFPGTTAMTVHVVIGVIVAALAAAARPTGPAPAIYTVEPVFTPAMTHP